MTITLVAPRQPHDRAVGGRRLRAGDVDSGAGDEAGVEGALQRLLIHQSAPRRIDEQTAFSHRREDFRRPIIFCVPALSGQCSERMSDGGENLVEIDRVPGFGAFSLAPGEDRLHAKGPASSATRWPSDAGAEQAEPAAVKVDGS